MTSRRLSVLFVVALVVIGAAVWLGSARNSNRPTSAGTKVMPGLMKDINAVTEVRIVTAGEQETVKLTRADQSWRVAQRDGYPADAAKLRKLLIDLAQLDVVEEKTADAANYAKLGVEDVKAADATGARVDLIGLPKPAGLIIGKNAGGSGTYVRLNGTQTSLQTKPAVSVERDARNWIDRTLLDFPGERVQQVRVTLPGSTAYVAKRDQREQTDFSVEGLPKGKKLSGPTAVNPVTGALSGLTLDDVHRAQAADDWGNTAAKTEYLLFDGTTISVAGHQDEQKHHIRLSIGFDEAQYERFKQAAAPPATPAATPSDAPAAKPAATATADEVKKAAQAAAAKVDGWVYEIPAYKYETLFQPVDDLLSKP